MREPIRQCTAWLTGAAVIIATVAACGVKSSASTSAIGSTPSASLRASTKACSTQGGGGDNVPVPCAPTAAQSAPGGLTPPATESGKAAPTVPCSNPSVVSVSPASGNEAGGDLVTITGTGFGVGLSVFFGGSLAPTFSADSTTEASGLTPPGSAGPSAVTVSCGGVVSSTLSPAPEVSYQAGGRTALPDRAL